MTNAISIGVPLSIRLPQSLFSKANVPRRFANRSLVGSPAVWLALCLGLTAVADARADSSRSDGRSGLTLRVGSMAGTTEFRDEDVITVGLQGAFGYQLGPMAVELEHERGLLLEGQAKGSRGSTSRSAINARLFAPDISRPLSRETLLRLYLEAGLGRSQGTFGSGANFARSESSVGGGIILDHRSSSRRTGGIRYAGWHVGWSLRVSDPTDTSPSFSAACKSGQCPTLPTPEPASADLNLMFISSLNFSW